MAKLSCTICSSPPDVRNAIDEALYKKEKLRDLEKRCAFSRATLSRHSRRCLPKNTLEAHRTRGRFNQYKHRIWIAFPDCEPYLFADVTRPHRWSHLAKVEDKDIEDVCLRVVFAPAVKRVPEIPADETITTEIL
jgi:hypothetical protein